MGTLVLYSVLAPGFSFLLMKDPVGCRWWPLHLDLCHLCGTPRLRSGPLASAKVQSGHWEHLEVNLQISILSPLQINKDLENFKVKVLKMMLSSQQIMKLASVFQWAGYALVCRTQSRVSDLIWQLQVNPGDLIPRWRQTPPLIHQEESLCSNELQLLTTLKEWSQGFIGNRFQCFANLTWNTDVDEDNAQLML